MHTRVTEGARWAAALVSRVSRLRRLTPSHAHGSLKKKEGWLAVYVKVDRNLEQIIHY